MGSAASTALGIVVGLIVFLAMAMMGVIGVNGVDNPGISPAGTSVAAAGGTAPAAEAGDGSFSSLDLNGDGRVSLSEVAGNGDIVTRFHRADRNKDGKLTSAEFDRLAKLPPPKERPKPKSQIRRDAEAQLSSSRQGP